MNLKLKYKNQESLIQLIDLNISSLYNEINKVFSINNKQFVVYINDLNNNKIYIENFFHFSLLEELYKIRGELTVFIEDKEINNSLIKNILLKKSNFENSLNKERSLREKKIKEEEKTIKDQIEEKISLCKNDLTSSLISQLSKRCFYCYCSLLQVDYFTCIYCKDLILCLACEELIGRDHGHPFLLHRNLSI